MLKKLNTSSLKAAAPTKAKKEKPLFKNEEIAPQVDELVKLMEEAEAIDGSIKVIKSSIRTAVFPAWLEANKATAGDTVSTLKVLGTDVAEGSPKSVDFSFTEGYKSKVDDESQAKLAEIMGDEFFMANFRQKITLGVDMDLVPDKATPAVVMMALTVEQAEFLNAALAAMPAAKKSPHAVAIQAKTQQAVENFNAEDTLGQAVINGINHVASALALPDNVVTVKELVLPIKGFNKLRATEFTLEQNIAIDEVIKTPDSMKKGA